MSISISIFRTTKKVHESDPNSAKCEADNTLYPHINNNIEYGLFEDVINSYYLDSQIKDDFKCDKNCHIRTKHTQQDQTLTPCTHAYDHITQHINNLEDPIQQHTVHTNEVDASLFTTDTTTPCDYNKLICQIQTIPMKIKPIPYSQGEFILEVNINTEMFLAILTSNIMTLIMVMHSLSQINIQHYYNKNYKTLIGAYMTP